MTTVSTTSPAQAGYVSRLATLILQGLAQVVRPASHSRRAEARRTWARRTLLLSAGAALLIVALMVWLDAAEITWMPPRGTASLWPLRILTDFGKANYIIVALLIALTGVLLLAPRVIGTTYATLVLIASRLQFMLLAILLPVWVGEVLKGMIGRGRPFVGGEANAFHFSHFAWSEAYASFPSGHATASCAFAFAIAALWPKLRVAMVVYAMVILATRLVLLAHHPSDVMGGALLGVMGAMIVRYWFAARGVVFSIRPDGGIVARRGPSLAAVGAALQRSVTF